MSQVVGEAVVNVRTDESGVDIAGAGQRSGDGYGKGFVGGLGKIMGGAAIAGIAAGVGKAFMGALDLDQANARVQAQLGLTESEAATSGRVAGELFSQNYGDSMAEVQASIGAVQSGIKGLRGASEADLQAASAAALGFSDVFEQDVETSVAAASQLINSGLAKDAVVAFDLMTAAAQQVGPGLVPDLQDAVTEYGQYFNQIGLSGKAGLETLVSASDRGVFGIDKAGDAIKEFTIRATDGSKASTDALEGLGLSATDMSNAILKGGSDAGLATREIVDGLLAIKDPTEQANTAIALFGTPLEDLGTKNIPRFLESIGGASNALGEVEGASKRAADTLYDTPLAQVQGMFRQVTAAVTGLAVDALPYVIDGVGAFTDVVRELAPVVSSAVLPVLQQIGTVFTTSVLPALTQIGDSVRANFLPLLTQIGNVLLTQVIPPVQAFISYAVSSLLPVFAQIGNIVATQVIPTVAALARFFYSQVLPAIVSIATTVATRLKPVFDQLVATFRTQVLPTVERLIAQIRDQLIPALQPIVMRIVAVVGAFVKFAAAVLGRVLPPLIRLAGFIFSRVVPAIVAVVTKVAQVINFLQRLGGAIGGAIARVASFGTSLVRLVTGGINQVVSAVSGLPGKIIGLGSKMLGAGKELISKLLSGMGESARGVGGFVSGLASSVGTAIKDAAKAGINAVIDAANNAIPNSISMPGPVPDINLPDNPIPRLQRGAPYGVAGGYYNVGEVGPERVYLPPGARVLSAAATRQADSGGEHDGLVAALAAVLAPYLVNARQINVTMPTGDPIAAAQAVLNRSIQ